MFNTTAHIQVQVDAASLRSTSSRIRRSVQNISGNININIDPRSQALLQSLSRNLQALNSNLSSTSAVANKASSSLNSIKTTAFAAGVGRTNKSLKGMSSELNTTNKELVEFGRVSGLALRRFAGFTLATTVVFGFINAVRDGVKQSIEFERSLVKIAQVRGKTIESISALRKEVGELSIEFGANSAELLDISRIFAQAGLNIRQVEQATKALARSNLAPTFGNMKSTAEGAIAIMRQFYIQAKNLEKSLASINTVAGRFAVESEDIIQAVRRAGGIFSAAAGQTDSNIDSLRNFIATFTSVRQTTRENSEAIATGLRTIFTRIQRLSTIRFYKDLTLIY